MRKTKTTRYDIAEHLRTPERMAAYLEACLDEAKGDAAFIAKALGDIALDSSCSNLWISQAASASALGTPVEHR